jgi:branched-chain amino acid aminotransferase
MKGLYMEPFPTDKFVKAAVELVHRNKELGFFPTYDTAWEKDGWMNADSVYIRPFSYTEGAIGVGTSQFPMVVIVATTVSSYFNPNLNGAVITDRVRATPHGTGCFKVASNYVMSALAKHEAAMDGFVECVFLDAVDHKYIEEGSSCNVFFVLKNGNNPIELVTPALGDTILPGITRASIIELARDKGIKTTERKISIDEVMSDACVECFFSGTAAGASPVDSFTYKGKKKVFGDGTPGKLTVQIRDEIKGIQYGAIPDKKGWLFKV